MPEDHQPVWERVATADLCLMSFLYIYVNSLDAGQTSEDIHSLNATDLFRMAKDDHTYVAFNEWPVHVKTLIPCRV